MTVTDKSSIFSVDGESVFTEKIEPSIYAFVVEEINEVLKKNSLKVGDTRRFVEQRMNEWREHYPNLVKTLERPAFFKNSNNAKIYFRDHAVHRYLTDNGFLQVPSSVIHSAGFDYASQEFYTGTESQILTEETVKEAISHISENFGNHGSPYKYYTSFSDGPKIAVVHYNPTADFELREFQKIIIQNAFNYFVNSGSSNSSDSSGSFKKFSSDRQYLLTSPTRSGKSHMAMRIAKRVIDASDRNHSVALIVTGYAEVDSEWRQTVEGHKAFNQRSSEAGDGYVGDTDWVILNRRDFDSSDNPIEEAFENGAKNAAVFLTLQDLAGSTSGDGVKRVHRWLEKKNAVQFVIADEAHFAVFTENGRYQEALGTFSNVSEDSDILEDSKSSEIFSKISETGEIEDWTPSAEEEVESSKRLKGVVPEFGTLFVTATPFNILSSGFGFVNGKNASIVTESDIWKEKESWDDRNDSLPEDDRSPEWDNPCYGLPKRYIFAVNLSLSTAGKNGSSISLNELFGVNNGGKFVYEDSVRNLVEAMFGLEDHTGIPNILRDENFQKAGLGNHIYMTLPTRAAVDAFAKILKDVFEASGISEEYLVLDISSEKKSRYSEMTANEINAVIDGTDKKTITVSCERMGTGVTQKKWDTVMILRSLKSSQKFVQISGRAGTPWVETHREMNADGSVDSDGDLFKTVEKPNCAVIGFDPFQTLLINYEVNKIDAENRAGKTVNDIDARELDEEISDRLSSSPLYVIDLDPKTGNGLRKMTGSDILQEVLKYAGGKGVRELADSVSIDPKYFIDEKFIETLERFVPVSQSSRKSGELSAYGEMDESLSSPICMSKDCENLKETSENFCEDCLEEQRLHREKMNELKAREKALKEAKKKDKDADSGDCGSPEPLSDAEKFELKEEKKRKTESLNRFRTAIASILLLVALSPEKERSLSEIFEKLQESKKVNGRYFQRAKNLNVHEGLVEFLLESGSVGVELDNMIFILQDSLDKAETPWDRMELAINSFGRFSQNEIPTPLNVAELVNEKISWNSETVENFKNGLGVIDPGCKSGVMLFEFYNRGLEAGLTHEEMRDKLFAIPTSSSTFELLRTFFNAMDWNEENILYVDGVSGLSVLEELSKMLSEDGKLSKDSRSFDKIDASKSEEVERLMEKFNPGEKFGFAVSNPPYQMETRKTNEEGVGDSKNIFQIFQEKSLEISDSTSMIYPAGRWIRGTGKGCKSFGQNLLTNSHLKEITYFNGKEAREIFPSVNIGDGLSVVFVDQSNDFEEIIFNETKFEKNSENRIPLIDSDLIFVIKKLKDSDFNSLEEKKIVKLRISFDSTVADSQKSQEVEENSEANGFKDPVKALIADSSGKKGRVKLYWIENSVEDNSHLVDSFKVVMNSNIQGNESPKDFRFHMIDSGVLFGYQRIPVGYFETLDESKNFYSYVNSLLIRIAISAASGSRNRIGTGLFSFVPDLGDYTNSNPLFQSDGELGSDHEYYGLTLDQRLYKMFELTEDEISVIEEF